jgi:hypothetical protein
MPSLKQLAILGLAGACLCGCDASSNPENQARAKMNEGRIAAATGDEAGRAKAQADLTSAANISGVSNATSAQAHAVLGQVQYDIGLEFLRLADRKELAASQIALQIAALGAQLGNSAQLVQGYQKLDPSAAKTAIAQDVVQVKGSPDKPAWQVTDQVKITAPSVAAADQEVARIQGEIAKRQTQIKDLDAQRVAALKEADDAQKASEAAKGRESVDLFKKYSDAKKQAADLQSQIDVINGQLMPLQNDLEIAVGQQQIMQAAIAELENQSRTLDQGWKDIQSKIQAQTDLIAQISAAPAEATTEPSETMVAAGKSIAVKATILAQTVKDAEEVRGKASEALQQAIDEFGKAASDANQAGNDMSTEASDQPALQSVIKVAKEVLSVQGYKLRQATAERVYGEMMLSKASGISARIKLRELLTPLMAQAGQTMPKELADTTLDNQLKEAVKAANDKFQDAAGHLDDILNNAANDSIAKSTQQAAAISKVFLLYSQQQLATLTGDKAGADKAHADAVALIKSAATDMQVNFPALPGDLAAAIPPPPAPAPTEQPTTAPTTEGATAEADSPDVQSCRTVFATFLQAALKGDLDAAKAVSQIDPGGEDMFNQFTTLLVAAQKLDAAMHEKFPDLPSSNSGSPADIANGMKQAKIAVKGDEGFMTLPAAPEKKWFVKADNQWKVYFGAPTDQDKAMLAAFPKLTGAFNTFTADVQAGKYTTAKDAQTALIAAMMSAAAPGGAAAPPAQQQ